MLTAAVSLRKQGATKGATTAFLISTPESGLDSIAVSYALLDPILTIARPVAAFITAFVAGIIENLFSYGSGKSEIPLHHPCPVDGCCDGIDCAPQVHKSHHRFAEKLRSGVRYAVCELWADIAGWFFIGLLLAGAITAIVPEAAIGRTVGSGLPAMLIMLAVGVPLYICATASTPIAAALILKGISPGAALVFLLAGPATNVATLTVLVKILGKRATADLSPFHRRVRRFVRPGGGSGLCRAGYIRQGHGGQGGGNYSRRGSMGCRRSGSGHIGQAGGCPVMHPVQALPAFG